MDDKKKKHFRFRIQQYRNLRTGQLDFHIKVSQNQSSETDKPIENGIIVDIDGAKFLIKFLFLSLLLKFPEEVVLHQDATSRAIQALCEIVEDLEGPFVKDKKGGGYVQ